MSTYRLVIGNMNTSSWSLRPWLGMKVAGIPFHAESVNLRAPDAKAQILKHSPSGKVPVLLHHDLAVWDSLAILEYLAERHPEDRLWPIDEKARAVARSVSAEMHSGFATLRQNCPMDIMGRPENPEGPQLAKSDIERILSLWGECLTQFGQNGPFLFGKFTIADAMYAPVVSRFTTYGVAVSPEIRAYMDAVWALPAMQEWQEGAKEEVALKSQ
ncbi:MAG: glutathione S-transferase family protein [Alphaproteobacteria bacterium]|nr:glutathione S-transferase family protein [Alphaproteobacteria bacterium]